MSKRKKRTTDFVPDHLLYTPAKQTEEYVAFVGAVQIFTYLLLQRTCKQDGGELLADLGVVMDECLDAETQRTGLPPVNREDVWEASWRMVEAFWAVSEEIGMPATTLRKVRFVD